MSPLHHALRPIYLWALFFGVSPFLWTRIPFKAQCELLIVTLLALLHTCLSVRELTYWYRQSEIEGIEWNLGFRVYLLIKMLYVAAALLSLWVSWIHRRRFRCTIQCLEGCDVSLGRLNVRLNHRKERLVGVALGLLSYICLILYALVGVFVYRKPGKRIDVLVTLGNLFMKLSLMSSLYVYTIVVQRGVLVRFRGLNECLRKLFLSHREEDSYGQEEEEVLLSLAALHGALEGAYKMHSECFALQLLGFFCPYVLSVVHLLFTVYVVLEGSGGSTPLIALETIWVGYSTLFHILLVVTATAATKEALHSARLLHEIVNKNDHRPLNKALSLFSRQLYHLDVKISCAVFDFDWSLFMGTLGITTTYLIILIQFKDF